MRRWLLPEGIEDLLPQEAEHVEGLRRRLLDEFDRHGYRLVAPPLLEYVDSLLTGSGRDLDLRTFKLVDQLSGQTMGLRADIAPQVARIDAHLLNEAGVTRLCYCGSVLHARPEGLLSSREPLQIGAELYGHAGCEADSEIIRLLARGLELTRVTASRIDLGHVGIFRALMTDANVGGGQAEEIFAALQTKDAATLEELTRSLPDTTRAGLRALPALYGGAEVLEAAARLLPATPAIKAAIETLNRLAHDLAGLPVGFDLADLRGYHYHNGVVFAAYCDGSPRALARGGRYDNAGEVFGRARPATGFSMDLRDIARLAPREAEQRAILAPWPEDAAVHAEVERLRGLGEKVVLALPGHDGHWREAGCNRRLVRRGPEWIIESLKEE